MDEQSSPTVRVSEAEALTPVDGLRDRGRGTVILSVLITTSAIGLVALHVVRPKLRIDGISLALIFIAVLPWLGSIFKAVQLPGGWRFEYQQFKQVVQKQLSEVSSRVDRVEQYVFSGEVTPELKDRLTRALHEFNDYLGELGFHLPPGEPQIHIEATTKRAEWLARYEPETNRIVISSQHADDPDLAEKQYAHHALIHSAACDGAKWQWDAQAIEAGLATYLVCSHNDRPLLGLLSLSKTSAPVSSSNWGEDLRNSQKVSDTAPPALPQLAGLAWGGAMWDVRQTLGRDVVDRVLVSAWRELNVCQEGAVTADFTSRILGALQPDSQRKVKSIFRRRGILN